jgi:YfiH family protein
MAIQTCLNGTVPKEPTKKELAAIDKWLAGAGFKRARRPKGALKRARSVRDARVAPGNPKSSTRKIEVLRPGQWKWPWLRVGFSTRTGGVSTVFGGNDLNLGFGKHDSREKVEQNRGLFLKAVSASEKLVTLKQIHSATVHVARGFPKKTLVGDGVITNVPGLALAVLTADCVPVLVVDPKRKAVGAFHAGWRGTVQRVVEKGVGTMRMEYGSDPADLYAAIGPCIQQCCYAVGDEVVDRFQTQFSDASALFREVYDDDPIKRKYPLLFLTARAPGHSDLGPQTHLDLAEANRRQLLASGLKADRIWTSDLCTSCNTDKLFSHRKEDGFTGRQMAVIGIAG